MAGLLGKFSGKSCDSNVFNNNDMHLSRELFENVIASEEYRDAIERGHYIGYLGHPEDPACQEFQNACIVMTDMSIEDNGDIHAEFNLVDTPVGRIVKAFIDAGVKFGISIRGAGDVAGDGEVDPETFIFRGYDLVAFPAYNDCIPEFQAIAASKDLDKQKKYKKVCAAVTKNLSAITSTEALELIQEQFAEGSEPYAEVSARLAELASDNNECIESECSVENQQVGALVDMYAEALEEIERLQSDNQRLSESLHTINTQCLASTSKMKRVNRIHRHQLNSLNDAVIAAERRAAKSEQRYVEASAEIRKLSNEVDSAKKLNLNYNQKIQSSKSILTAKDKEIERLSSKLRETVAASKEFKTAASNCDARVSELQSKVQAAEDMIFAYQQAYANLFANALGKEVSNLSVTASTDPEELKSMILGSTSTANIPAKPDYSCDEYFEDDCNDNGIVTV